MRRSCAGFVQFTVGFCGLFSVLVSAVASSDARAQDAVFAKPYGVGADFGSDDSDATAFDDSASEEVLIGTVDVPPPPAAPQTPMLRAAPFVPVARSSTQPYDHRSSASNGLGATDDSAAADYAKALVALDARDFAAAERWFEKVIAVDPHGPQADDSRRHLGQLYTGTPAANAAISRPDTLVRPEAARNKKLEGKKLEGSERAREAFDQTGIDGGDDDGPGQSSARIGNAENDEESFITQAGDRVFFSPSSSDLGARARSILSAQASWLKKRPEWNVIIEGHADDPPLLASDLEALSQARAEAVRQRLLEEGVASARIMIVAFGRNAPISDCPDAACQVQNRRVVSTLTPRRRIEQSGLATQNRNNRAAADLPWSAQSSDARTH